MNHGFHTLVSVPETTTGRLDPRTKIALTLIYAVMVVSTPPHHLRAMVAYAGLLSWAVAWSRIPLLYVVYRAAAVLPISALAALWLPLLQEGPTVSLFGGSLVLSVGGLWLLAGVAMKSFLGAGATVLLIATTPLGSLAGGLRQLGAPVILIDMLTLTYRYLFVLVEEAGRLRRASAARGYQARWLGQALLVGRLIGQLFMRSYERAERVHGAMLLRGYRGQLPATSALCFTTCDVAAIGLLIPILVMVRAFLR